MRIQHNILAMNAYRNYSNNVRGLGKNLERLSSGYKINRAGDDAAGLAISEKMRAQITGLDAAQKNVKDGISLVKTAEGAMQEIQDMLNRMDYLATQSANGTYDDSVDRAALQKEVDQLKSEINRIADSANFNGIQLLDGSQGGASGEMSEVTVEAGIDGINPTEKSQRGIYEIDLKGFKATASSTSADGSIAIKIGSVSIAKITVDKETGEIKISAAAASVTIGDVKFSVTVEGEKIKLEMKEDLKADFDESMLVEYTYTGTKKADGYDNEDDVNNAGTHAVRVLQHAIFAPDRRLASGSFDLGDIKDGTQIKIGKTTYTFAVGKDSKFKSASNVVDLSKFAFPEDATKLGMEAARRLTEVAKSNSMFKVTTDNTGTTIYLTEIDGAVDYNKYDMVGKEQADADATWKGLVFRGQATTGGGLTLQIGDTSESYNQLSIDIGDMHTTAMGIGAISIADQDSAAAAIQTIRDAINYVSGVRGDLGAAQNRLEHTQNNLSVMAENIQDAESTIRDTDVAEEMMSYVKNNILVQSAQAMLAQANQVPQGVLQLLG